MFKILSTYIYLKNTQYIYLLKKIYKMQHLEGSGTPILYVGCTVLNPYPANVENMVSSK